MYVDFRLLLFNLLHLYIVVIWRLSAVLKHLFSDTINTDKQCT